jgi:hypothetical protein
MLAREAQSFWLDYFDLSKLLAGCCTHKAKQKRKRKKKTNMLLRSDNEMQYENIMIYLIYIFQESDL